METTVDVFGYQESLNCIKWLLTCWCLLGILFTGNSGNSVHANGTQFEPNTCAINALSSWWLTTCKLPSHFCHGLLVAMGTWCHNVSVNVCPTKSKSYYLERNVAIATIIPLLILLPSVFRRHYYIHYYNQSTATTSSACTATFPTSNSACFHHHIHYINYRTSPSDFPSLCPPPVPHHH